MVSLAGIIHPSAFQIKELLGTLKLVYKTLSPKNQTPQSESIRFRNLELGIWGQTFAKDEVRSCIGGFDGVIHNLEQVKKELIKKGYQFTSNDPAEVLLQAYDAFDEKFVSKLIGSFSIIIFDEHKQTLFIFRDRFGAKNLYWTTTGNYFLFATELKALLATGLVPQTPAIDGLGAYLHFGFVPQDLSPIKGVMKLLPGHYLKVNLKRQYSIVQHWSYSDSFENKISCSRETAYEELAHHFSEAIETAGTTTETAGALLTNHLGPVALTSQLNPLTPTQYPCFGVSFEGGDDSIITPTETIAKELGLDFKTHSVTIDTILKDLVKIVWIQDEPLAALNALRVFYVAQTASLECQRLYTPIGWEETFAGHPRYFLDETLRRPSLAQKVAHLPPFLRDKVIMPLCDTLHSPFKYRILRNLDINLPQMQFVNESALFSEKERHQASQFLFRYFDPEVFSQRFHRLSSVKGWIDPFLYFDAKTKLPDEALLQHERLVSAHGLELVTPFLDHRLAEYLATMPDELKFEGRIPGVMLKQLLEKKLPNFSKIESLLSHRPTYPSYLKSWRKDPRFLKLFASLEKGLLADEGLVSPRWIRQQLGYPYLIERNFAQLWSLLTLEIWFRLFINRPIGSISLDTTVSELLLK